MEQSWRVIDDFENYEVSNLGKVRNITTGKNLNGWIEKKGYMRVGLYNNGKKTNKYIHRLVAEAFIENPNNSEQVDHINGIKTDNKVENLRWVTSSQNNFNKRTIGNRVYEFVDDVPRPFVKITQYGKHIFDRLFYSGLTEKFYMLIDEVVGYREIIPSSHGNSYRIRCYDISYERITMGFAKIKNYSIDMLELKYADLLSELTEDDITYLLELENGRDDILKEYNISAEELDLILLQRNIN